MALNYIFYSIPKIIRLLLAYVSLQIATNYMSQIYTENVLVNNTDPPSLINLVILFIIIDLILNALVLLVLFVTRGATGLQNNDLRIYVAEYLIIIIALFIQMYIVASTMYNKKFFLYQDDGLRAIRALNNLFIKFIFLYNIIPFGFLLDGRV